MPLSFTNFCSQSVDGVDALFPSDSIATGGTCLVDAVLPYQLTGGVGAELTCEGSGYLTGRTKQSHILFLVRDERKTEDGRRSKHIPRRATTIQIICWKE